MAGSPPMPALTMTATRSAFGVIRARHIHGHLACRDRQMDEPVHFFIS
jgi:hypothetical protein